MTYEEAEKLAFSSKWKIGTCGVGENCWCRTIKPEDPIIYDNNEDYYIIGMGAIHKDLAEHIVKLHNESLK